MASADTSTNITNNNNNDTNTTRTRRENEYSSMSTTATANPGSQGYESDGNRTLNNEDVEQRETPAPKMEKTDDRIKVEWEEGDPKNPFNWSTKFKIWVTLQLGIVAFAASLGSSIISPAEKEIAAEFHVSTEVVVLNVSLYVVGFAVGPLLWAPISEIWGRRWSMLPALFCLGLFSIGSATSKTLYSLLITRFFGGLFGSAPVSNVSAALGDFWSREARGNAVALYAVAVVGGPCLGPTIGAALTLGGGWRWTEYAEAILVFVVVVWTFFCMPELYGPVLLKEKAQKMRKETGDQRLYHPHEELDLNFQAIVTKQLSRPLLMLFTEPMVMVIAFYASFVYALLYMSLEFFPIAFEQMRGWNSIVGSLPFLGLFIGVLCALTINLGNNPRYVRKVRASNGRPVPEARCPPMAIGGVIFVIGLFWFGWTANPHISWVSPCFAAIFIGAGFNCIFQQCINFLVDTYGLYAASATAANTFLRSILAAGLPLAIQSMVRAMGFGGAMSLLGGVATVMLPVPFLFMKYGRALRKRSRFAPIHE